MKAPMKARLICAHIEGDDAEQAGQAALTEEQRMQSMDMGALRFRFEIRHAETGEVWEISEFSYRHAKRVRNLLNANANANANANSNRMVRSGISWQPRGPSRGYQSSISRASLGCRWVISSTTSWSSCKP